MSSAVAVQIPPGYLELPLDESATATSFSGAHVGELLAGLGDSGVRYCGLGQHASPTTGRTVTSWLTVAVYEAPGATQNPRLVLKGLAEAKLAARAPGEIVVGDLDGRPVLLCEQAAAPRLRAVDRESAAVYQLQVVVPSSDATAVAAIELSTRATEDGPRFRTMVTQMARSVRFEPHRRPTLLQL